MFKTLNTILKETHNYKQWKVTETVDVNKKCGIKIRVGHAILTSVFIKSN